MPARLCESHAFHDRQNPTPGIRTTYLGPAEPIVWRLHLNMVDCGCSRTRAICQKCFDHIVHTEGQAHYTRCGGCNSRNTGHVLAQVQSFNRIVSD